MRAWNFLKKLLHQISQHDLFTLAAALSYYTALSISPLLLIALWILQSLGLGDQEVLLKEISALVGPQAAEGIKMIMTSANQHPSTGSIAGLIGLGALFVSASAVFGQLQFSFNRIWNVKVPEQTDWMEWLRKRLLSFGMVLGLGFVSVVSLVVDTALSFMSDHIVAAGFSSVVLGYVESATSFIVFILIFSALFRLLPDVRLRWRDVWAGAVITALLFVLGKEAIGMYLGQSSIGAAFGAAGSLVVFLVWVYYSSMILFIGGEVTQIISSREHIRVE